MRRAWLLCAHGVRVFVDTSMPGCRVASVREMSVGETTHSWIDWLRHSAERLLGGHTVDPKTVIASGALAVSLFALLTSRGATRIAEVAHGEHGKLKDVRLFFPSMRTVRKGIVSGYSSVPRPARDPEQTTVIAVYGGPDTLTVNRIRLLITYTTGILLRTRLVLELTIDGAHLHVNGPKFPTTVEAYHRVVWELPGIIIPPHSFSRKTCDVVNARFEDIHYLRVFEEVSLTLVVDYGDTKTISSKTVYGTTFPLGVTIDTRVFYGIEQFLKDSVVQEHAKHLVKRWHKAPRSPTRRNRSKPPRQRPHTQDTVIGSVEALWTVTLHRA